MLSNGSFSNLSLTDAKICYKLFRDGITHGLQLTEKRFCLEPKITAKVAHVPEIRLYQVGINYYGRTYAKGKKTVGTMGFALFSAL